ncbi:MAG TPA: hypothetical protein VLE43_02375 [Candidatus Saccharimonadia bacterium]|nr:hypothetical protein [Candidatus Saccharimonadia bacterium]
MTPQPWEKHLHFHAYNVIQMLRYVSSGAEYARGIGSDFMAEIADSMNLSAPR